MATVVPCASSPIGLPNRPAPRLAWSSTGSSSWAHAGHQRVAVSGMGLGEPLCARLGAGHDGRAAYRAAGQAERQGSAVSPPARMILRRVCRSSVGRRGAVARASSCASRARAAWLCGSRARTRSRHSRRCVFRVRHLAHPEPGLDVLRVGVQRLGQQALARGPVAVLDGLDGLLKRLLACLSRRYSLRSA